MERELSCASQKQRTSYERANGLGMMDRDAWIRAYEQRNRDIVAFFSKRSEAHRLLVLQDLDTAPPKRTWEALCNFLEAWSTCPSNRIIPRTRVKTRKCDVKPVAVEEDHPPTPPPLPSTELSVRVRRPLPSTARRVDGV